MKSAIVTVLFLPLLSGCYMKGSVEDIDASTKVIQRTSAFETISGSKHPTYTTSGAYQVSHTVGGLINEVNVKTDGGYQVYTGVQASVLTEGEEE